MKKTLIILLCMLMLVFTVTSCSQEEEVSSASQTPSTGDEEPTEPEEEEKPTIYPSMLTGLEKDEDYPINQRPVAIMVNNRIDGLPHSGVSEASVCYEMVTEGGITRYMLVYEDYTTIPEVGPIRSARDPHVQFMAPLNALYVHDGGSTMAMELLDVVLDWENGDFGPDGAGYRKSRPGYSSDETEYVNAESLMAAAEDPKYITEGEPIAPITLDGFVRYDEDPVLPTDGSAHQVSWSFSQSYDGYFEYNSDTNQYEKSQFGIKLTDANNDEPFSYENLLVLFTNIVPYGNTVLMDIDLDYGGVGYYFYGGEYQEIVWRKGAPTTPLRILNDDGTETPVLLNTGKTYVAVVGLEWHDTTFTISGEDGENIMQETVENPDELVEAD